MQNFPPQKHFFKNSKSLNFAELNFEKKIFVFFVDVKHRFFVIEINIFRFYVVIVNGVLHFYRNSNKIH